MKGPRDDVKLVVEHQHGIEVDRCPDCNGRWLDSDELAQLEASVPSTEEQRVATIEYANRSARSPRMRRGPPRGGPRHR